MLVLLTGAMATPPPDGAVKPAYFSIATGSTVGSNFAIGSMIATILSHPAGSVRCQIASACGPEGLIAVAVASPGSAANVRDVAEGRIDSAFAQSTIAGWAYQGTESFKGEGPYTNLRAIAGLYPEVVHLVVARGAGIKSLRNLRRRRISIDIQGTGTHAIAMAILGAQKLSRRSLELVQADADRSVKLLAAKQIDGFFFVGAEPADAIVSLVSEGVADLVPIDGPAVKALMADEPYITKATIPADTYPGIGRIDTVAVSTLWVVNASASEELVYRLTRALWDPSNQPLLMRGNAQARNMSLRHALDGITIPLHPGAVRFYTEKGLISASRRAPKGAEIHVSSANTR